MSIRRTIFYIIIFAIFSLASGNTYARGDQPDVVPLAGTSPAALPMIDPFQVSTDWADGYKPAVAYNSTYDEYLVVWHYFKNIYAQRVDSRGDLLGSRMDITSGTVMNSYPSVAYDPDNNRYLIVWQREDTGGSHDIYGRIIYWGGPVSWFTPFEIDSTSDDTLYPEIAFSLTSQEYMVVWTVATGVTPKYHIDGRRVTAVGPGFPASSFTIAQDASENRRHPDIAYNQHRNQYLVVYDSYYYDMSDTNKSDIFATLLNANGSIDNQITVASWPGHEYQPAVAACYYNEDISGSYPYLVAWKAEQDPWNEIYMYLLNGDGTSGVIKMVDDRASGSMDIGIAAACRWERQFMLVWERVYSGYIKSGLDARLIYGDGDFDTIFNVILPEGDLDREAPAIANGKGQFLVAWEHRDEDSYADVYASILGDTKPKSEFTVSPTSGDTNTTFQFDASGSSDHEDDAADLEVRWDWTDDGTFDTTWSTEKTASHKFGAAGTMTVRLEVKDTYGLKNSTTKQIEVANTPPTASFTVSPDINEPDALFHFDASSSTDNEDPTSALLTCWDFDDDNICEWFYTTIKTIDWSYPTGGSHIVRLFVKDTEGLIDTATKTVFVDNRPTAAFTIFPTTGDNHTDFQFDATLSSDPDVGIYWISIRWDWEDDGIYDTNWNTNHRFEKNFYVPGTYTIRLQVRQFEGSLMDETTRELIVTKGPDWMLYLPYLAR